jgi:hypothetical protein
MYSRLSAAVIPPQIVVAMREIDVFLMKDGCPLEWRS